MKDFYVTQSIILIVLIALIVFGFTRFDTFLKQKSIDSCLKIASFTSEIGNANGKNTVSEPIKDWYSFCMKEKGYK